jgi:DNA-binding NtrC family response regulator
MAGRVHFIGPSGCGAVEADCALVRFNLLGQSPAFVAAMQFVRRFAPCPATVLVQGETGTGKELVARALHYLSDRSAGPFVPVNCGAIPDALFESELFGHARGAFTGARDAREGLIAQARGGTLLLDELEALSPRGQVAMLRFLQSQEYRPVGGAVARDPDVRVIGSTNVDLAALAARGEYRHDLVFRLEVLAIALPPLRARGDDAVLLAEAFLERLARQYGRAPLRLGEDARGFLRSHAWPGNVRELENLVHRAFLLADGPELRLPATGQVPHAAPAAAPGQPSPLTSVSFRAAKAKAIESFERAYVAELLARAQGNISLAARLAGKERSRLSKLIRKHGFSGAAFRAAISRSVSL